VRTQRLGDLLRIHPQRIGGGIGGERGAVCFRTGCTTPSSRTCPTTGLCARSCSRVAQI
jgi:hypothetical protein